MVQANAAMDEASKKGCQLQTSNESLKQANEKLTAFVMKE